MLQLPVAIGSIVGAILYFLAPQQAYVLKGAAQGTSYSIQYYATESKVTKKQVDSIFQVVDASMSLYQPHSLISQFNNGKEVVMDLHLKKVVEEAFLMHKNTEGIFDATIGPLTELWGFGNKSVVLSPGQRAILDAKKHVGMQYLQIKGNRLRKKQLGVKLDLNGIAQGYTVDLLSAYLLKRGIGSFIVELGGEIYSHGRKPDGSSFKVALDQPPQLQRDRIVVSLENAALTTSANFQEKKHLIDPKTGYPLQSDIYSVTVYAPNALMADGYDNALIGMGLEKAFKWLADYPELAAYFIYRDADGLLRDTATNAFKKNILDH